MRFTHFACLCLVMLGGLIVVIPLIQARPQAEQSHAYAEVRAARNPKSAMPADRVVPADPETYLKALVLELKKTWPKNRTINIVVHGHSVPAGYFKTPRVDTFNSYPHLLHVALNQRFPSAVINVITTAIGGEASPAGAKRFKADVLTHKPDLILIDYALNDRLQGLERSEAAWRSMIEAALARDVPVILLTPTAALKADMKDPKDPINLHAEIVRSLAKEYGIGLADSTAAFKQAVANGASYKDLMSHPVHPNRKGHQLVATQLLKWFPR